MFGLLYALVLLAVAVAKQHFGASGLYAGGRDFRTDRHGRDHPLDGELG